MTTKTNRERFDEVAANRVKRVLDSIDSLAKCANKSSYEYTDHDIKKMISTLKERLRNLEFAFSQRGNGGGNKFSF